jgi:hypothetical protein
MCQRWATGPVLAALAHDVTFEGTENLARFKSSEWAERGFCKQCGSNLFYFLVPAAKYMMSVGSFDDPTPFRLVREIFIDHKPAGYAFAGGHPRLTERETLAEHGVG